MIAIVLVVLVVGLVVRYEMSGPKLEISAKTTSPLALSGCVSEVVQFGYGIGNDLCTQSPGKSWYRATVTNVGGRGAWVDICSLEARDSSGKPIAGFGSIVVPMWITAPGVGARPYLAPGQSAILDWFLPSVPPTKVATYVGSCRYVVYRNPPA